MTREELIHRHPTDGELAAYLGRELRGPALREVEEHLAQCPVCREEVMDASEILGSGPRRRRRTLAPLVAAAAAMVLFFSLPDGEYRAPTEPVHRDTPAETRSAPALLTPRGVTQGAETFMWGRIPGADRYRLTLFDADGAVLWRETTSDSLISLPDTLPLAPGKSYLWQVEARVGWDLWEASDLLEFSLEGGDEASSGPGGAS